VERVVRVFRSFEEAAQADRDYYRQLTPSQRLDILLETIALHSRETDAPSEGPARVYRVVELSSR